MESRKLIIENNIGQLAEVQIFIERLSQEWSLAPGMVFELNLVLEEYIANLVNYGYDDSNIHEIDLEIFKEENQLRIVVIDDAGPFNITETPANTEIDKPVEERRIGGLGIHFIKKLTDHIIYASAGGRNRLELIKHLEEEHNR